ncbi:MAG: glutamate formimidoyltransferase [Candidatus Marinimicrobia bacterium]|nr:glutamate formimidoyltransferase [Candidatus Neomarinimicrobiota bacterium]
MQLIECVPNFSEGRNLSIIKQITDEIENSEGVRLLDVDPGADTNRTVVTFVGEPERVIDAAFKAIVKATELIDLRNHSGAHARMGATDVCPLVPVSNISMEETSIWAEKLAERVGRDLQIPIFLYENSAKLNHRSNLAEIRSGEFEGMADKILLPQWKPDFGPQLQHKSAGSTAIGARQFLIAYNINLNSMDRKIATDIALDIREKGRFKRDENGKVIRDDSGKIIMKPGKLKACKAVGWYIDEYKQAQISMNLVDFTITPPHIAFEECRKQARKRGVRVTGSELVGLIPLESILEIGNFYLNEQQRSQGVPENEVINIAVKSLGLDEISDFNPKEKIIEYQINPEFGELASSSIYGFANELSTNSPAPGGGSVSALMGSMGVALSAMVANLSIGKKGFEQKYNAMNSLAVNAQELKKDLLQLIDKDTDSFNVVMEAFRLPKKTDEQKLERNSAIQKATKTATMIPFQILEKCILGLDLAFQSAKEGNPNSITDAGVAGEALMAGARGAFLNVKINLKDIEDTHFINELTNKGNKLIENGKEKLIAIRLQVESILNAE